MSLGVVGPLAIGACTIGCSMPKTSLDLVSIAMNVLLSVSE
jgi:hypothetical protein